MSVLVVFYLEKLNPPMKLDLAYEKKTGSRIPNPWRQARKERLVHLPLAYYAAYAPIYAGRLLCWKALLCLRLWKHNLPLPKPKY